MMFGPMSPPGDPLPQNRCGGTPARAAFEFELPDPDPRKADLGAIVVRRAEAQEALPGCGHGVTRRYIGQSGQTDDDSRPMFVKGATVTICNHCDKPAGDGPQSD